MTGRPHAGLADHNRGLAALDPLAQVAEEVRGIDGELVEAVEITHVNLNDDTVEGLAHATRPLFSVQYHPEAAAGPHDADPTWSPDELVREAHVVTSNPPTLTLFTMINVDSGNGCHSALLVTQNRMSRESWEATIRWMQQTQNLWDLGKNEEIILNYLATYYAPEKKGRRQNLQDIEWYVLEN